MHCIDMDAARHVARRSGRDVISGLCVWFRCIGIVGGAAILFGMVPDAYGLNSSEACGPDTLTVIVPDTLVFYADTVRIPVRVDNTNCHGIVAMDIDLAYEKRIAVPRTPGRTGLTGAMTDGWSWEDNVIPGATGSDTLLIGLATADDTLSGSGGLVYVNLVTADIRRPDSTQVEFVRFRFNDGAPAVLPRDGWLRLRGYDGRVDTAPDTVYPQQGIQAIQVEVTDRDGDRDSGAIDSVQVWTYDVMHEDSQQVWLYERSVSDSVFQGTVDAQYGAGAADGDGVVAVSVGDTIYASYIDSLDAMGGTSERLAYTIALGTSGSLRVSYLVQAQGSRGGLRDTLRVEVTDADENRSEMSVDTVVVTIGNGSVVESETVRLPETGVSTDTFRGRVPTVVGAVGTNGDGVLVLSTQGIDLDTLTVSYVDTVTTHGMMDTLTRITYAVNLFGDVSGGDRVEAFDAHFVLAFSVGGGIASFRDSLVADVSGENEILAFDASLILQYRVRLIDAFPVQSDTTFNWMSPDPVDPKNHPFLK